ncbi:hypothetical protein INF26_08300 [Olsenella sp. DSM 107455]|uniref:SIR2-like domain-containing protein n=1 Tax=Thermophilibacter gallinarum TaxID=2779357 RepID=A0ABR9QUV4_9ACTN|nr:hypothetical protein [Thermophilibacter gallinarum]MBE5024841.1 hypothetical protein [Thermophilibacter gallinarum]
MDKTLLIGNGLNLTAGAISWNEMLDDLCPASLRITSDDENEEQVPLPIQFEIMGAKEGVRTPERRRDPYLVLKEKVKERLLENLPEPSSLHKQVYRTGINNIITTNYDYALESCSPRWDRLKARKWNPQQKYMLESTGSVEGIDFYHAHGTYDVVTSICIGYEHYMGYVQHMRSLLIGAKPKDETADGPLGVARLLAGEETSLIGTWPALFFSSDVAIVGLGLSFSEIDLWWLLAFRAAFFSGNHERVTKRNRIVYFDVKEAKDDEDRNAMEKRLKKCAKAIALDGLDVTYVPVVREGYQRGYSEVFDLLKSKDDWADIE